MARGDDKTFGVMKMGVETMPDCQDCDVFREWSGVQERVEENTSHRKKMTANSGTIERLWSAIDRKASRAFLVTSAVVLLGLVGTLFSLVYYSNQAILSEFVDMKANIKIIKAKLGIDGD